MLPLTGVAYVVIRGKTQIMANESDAQLLALARTALANRLAGDAVEEYGTATNRFRGCTIRDLRELIRDLERSTATPATFIKPICDNSDG